MILYFVDGADAEIQ